MHSLGPTPDPLNSKLGVRWELPRWFDAGSSLRTAALERCGLSAVCIRISKCRPTESGFLVPRILNFNHGLKMVLCPWNKNQFLKQCVSGPVEGMRKVSGNFSRT